MWPNIEPIGGVGEDGIRDAVDQLVKEARARYKEAKRGLHGPYSGYPSPNTQGGTRMKENVISEADTRTFREPTISAASIFADTTATTVTTPKTDTNEDSDDANPIPDSIQTSEIQKTIDVAAISMRKVIDSPYASNEDIMAAVRTFADFIRAVADYEETFRSESCDYAEEPGTDVDAWCDDDTDDAEVEYARGAGPLSREIVSPGTTMMLAETIRELVAETRGVTTAGLGA